MVIIPLTTTSLNVLPQVDLTKKNTGHVQITSNTANIQGSADGTNWATIASAVAAPNGVHVAVFPYMKLSAGTGFLIV